MASRISRTARSMRGLSTSSGIPLPLDDPGQAIQVGDDESSLRCFDGAYAVHEHRVQARLRSSLHVGDGIVATCTTLSREMPLTRSASSKISVSGFSIPTTADTITPSK